MAVLIWNEGTWNDFEWAGGVSGTNPRKKMLRLKLGITRLARDVRYNKMLAVHTGLSDSEIDPIFANPSPPLADYLAKLVAAKGKLDLIKSLEGQLEQLRMQADTALTVAQGDFEKLGGFVLSKAADRPDLIPTTGFEVAAEPSATPLTQVLNLVLTLGDNEGETDPSWNPVKGADGYEVQIATSGNGPWTTICSCGTSKTTLTGLTPLTRIWIRVRAFRGEEKGPWSDPAMTVVP